MSTYWTEKFNAASGMYQCPWCDRDLKPKVSNSEKNPGRSFVACSKDYGGCGMFSFLDAEPNAKFKPHGAKRGRVDGAHVMGGINQAPDQVAQRLAELATEISGVRSEIREVYDFVKQVTDN